MSLNAVSTLVLACSDMIEEDASAFLDLFDKIPFGLLMAMANELRGIVHQGHALAGMLYLVARRSASLTGQEATRCVQTAARISEAAKGRQMSSRAPTLRPGEDRAWPMALGDESQTPSRTFRVVAKGKLEISPRTWLNSVCGWRRKPRATPMTPSFQRGLPSLGGSEPSCDRRALPFAQCQNDSSLPRIAPAPETLHECGLTAILIADG